MGVSGEGAYGLTFPVGFLSERDIWAQALHNVIFIWGSTDVEMPRLNMELTRPGRPNQVSQVNEIVDDAVSDKNVAAMPAVVEP